MYFIANTLLYYDKLHIFIVANDAYSTCIRTDLLGLHGCLPERDASSLCQRIACHGPQIVSNSKL